MPKFLAVAKMIVVTALLSAALWLPSSVLPNPNCDFCEAFSVVDPSMHDDFGHCSEVFRLSSENDEFQFCASDSYVKTNCCDLTMFRQRAGEWAFEEEDDQLLSDRLLNAGQLHLYSVIDGLGDAHIVRLRSLVARHPELVDRLIHLAREERNIYAFIRGFGDIGERPEVCCDGCGPKHSMTRSYMNPSHGCEPPLGLYVTPTILSVLPMDQRLSLLEDMSQGLEPPHMMAWLIDSAGHARVPHFLNALELEEDWVVSRIEAGDHWWLKEIAVGLRYYFQTRGILVSDGVFFEPMYGSADYGWWVRERIDQPEEHYLDYLAQWIEKVSLELALEIISIFPHQNFLALVESVFDNVLMDLKQGDCSVVQGSVDTADWLMHVLSAYPDSDLQGKAGLLSGALLVCE